jgi:hypothetical protein
VYRKHNRKKEHGRLSAFCHPKRQAEEEFRKKKKSDVFRLFIHLGRRLTIISTSEPPAFFVICIFGFEIFCETFLIDVVVVFYELWESNLGMSNQWQTQSWS